ncbi:non-ribosomal peptide synthetase [Serratia plymuthica]|uniref:non-ribosomal peptide synthetase n=1 Tax=Serratia plymuthica TaxID=82996 RepID=UPI0018D6FCAC|nr:non-ribosomal peptide synthetase [Serratia plymuthica]QPS56458.1 amino acid adenylation domain-containing protein [Serratia plymuthica]CAI1955221.1 Dimodular nonribosomal peptide synthase [Serratia plymuthica]
MSAYSLTTVQQAVWLDQSLNPEIPLYNVGCLWHVEREISLPLFKEAIRQIQQQHDALQTTLKEAPQGVIQEPLFKKQIELHYHDFSKENDAFNQAKTHLRSKFIQPYQLYEDLLWRCHVARVNDTTTLWLLASHHLIADGTSISLLSRMIMDRYKQLKAGEEGQIGASCYQNFVVSDQAYQQSSRYERDRDWWLQRFAAAPSPILERRQNYCEQQTYPSSQVIKRLPHERFLQLERYAAERGSSAMHFFTALIALWFARIWQMEHVILGVPVHNRSTADHKQTLGMFSSMIPLRINVDLQHSFADLLRQIGGELRQCYRHQRFPIAELNRHLNLHQQGRRQLFDISFSLEVFPTDIELEGSQFKVENMHHGHEQLPLGIYLRHYLPGEDPLLEFNLNQAWFSHEDGERIAARIIRLLDEVLDGDPALPVGKLPLLLPNEQQQIFHQWNNTHQVWADMPQSLHQFLERQAECTPDAPALCYEHHSISYRQLNLQANRFAAFLRQQGLQPDDRIALCVDRGPEIVIALYAILKAGAAYVPLDPDYPQDRLRHMLQDCGAKYVLIDDGGEHALHPLRDITVPRLHLQRDSHLWRHTSADNLAPLASDPQRSLAYVIYTSGSTGKPKGVMNEHRGVINRLLWMQQAYPLTSEDVVLQKTPFSFDVSVWEFFWPLMVGARLALAKPGGHQDPEYLSACIAKYGVTTLHFVPSMLQLFLRHGDMAQCNALRRIMCSGEALPLATVQRCLRQLPQAELHNLYGPTEAAVDVSNWHCRPDDERALVPIGKPIANTQLYILDNQLQPLPPGVAGELHIGGIQVARGYLNRPELSTERFIADPFSHDPQARLYKTGDLARWLADGNIEYLGRNDFQVKIHGVRIELGEIEQQLRLCAGVEDAAILAKEDAHGGKRLVAYVIAPDKDAHPTDWRRQLQQHLPDYMVPSSFIRLEAFPLSPNGKLDRKALPAPTPLQDTVPYVPPQTPQERQLATFWGELLGTERIGLDDDFFALGGHSLHAIQLLIKLKRSGYSLSIKTLFAHPTLRRQARILTEGVTPDTTLAAPAPLQQLLTNLNQASFNFKQIKRLNRSSGTDNVWMIHPAVTGCDVYRDLANSLEKDFNVFGVNNYNLFQQPHITSLRELASYYLGHMRLSPSHPVRLLGWSLGGLIALEMAAQLESQGYRDIQLFLLDTFYRTQFQIRSEPGMLAPMLAMLGIDGEAADRALKAEPTELALAKQTLSAPLQHARITLFKATEDTNLNLAGIGDERELLAIADNGLSAISRHLHVHPLACNHNSIISSHDEIGRALRESTRSPVILDDIH